MAKQIGKGAALYYGDSATGPWTKVTQCESIGEITSESSDVDVTDLDSVEAEFIGGIGEPQDVAYSFYSDPLNAAHIQMRKDQEAQTPRYYKNEIKRLGVLIETAIFQGHVKRWGIGPFETRTAVKMPCVIKRSGGITWLNN
ncbi:MAG: hypothetical protein EWM72_02775 [Nitrospira sp.]|nr:MAG: hypothetical protein EWM72_02775 [Nitrospira sp.]